MAVPLSTCSLPLPRPRARHSKKWTKSSTAVFQPGNLFPRAPDSINYRKISKLEISKSLPQSVGPFLHPGRRRRRQPRRRRRQLNCWVRRSLVEITTVYPFHNRYTFNVRVWCPLCLERLLLKARVRKRTIRIWTSAAKLLIPICLWL
jgi:hypothetical protein